MTPVDVIAVLVTLYGAFLVLLTLGIARAIWLGYREDARQAAYELACLEEWTA